MNATGERATTATFADFVADTAWDGIPESARSAATHHLLDTLGCAVVATRLKLWKRVIITFANPGAAHRILGTGERAAATDACWLNGVLAAAFGLDAPGADVHPGPCVVPAAIAAAEQRGEAVSGEELLTAIIVRYETTVRISEWVGFAPEHYPGWHTPAFHGAIGAAAAAARLLSADREQIANALALATDMAGGGLIHARDDAKRVHTARAAQTRLLAALLALDGVEARHDVLEHSRWGYRRALRAGAEEDDGAADIREPADELGTAYVAFNRLAFKYYPFHSAAQTLVDNMSKLRSEDGVTPDSVLAIRVGVSTYIYEHDAMLMPARNLANANFSLPYAAALGLVRDVPRLTMPGADAEVFVHGIEDQRVLQVQEQVSLHPSATLDAENEDTMDTTVEVDTRDGRNLTQPTRYSERARAAGATRNSIAFDVSSARDVEQSSAAFAAACCSRSGSRPP